MLPLPCRRVSAVDMHNAKIMQPMFSRYIQPFLRSVSMHPMFSRYLQSFPRPVSMHLMSSRQVLCGDGAYCAQRRLSERVVLERGRERCDVHCLSRGDVQPFPRSVIKRSMPGMLSRYLQSFARSVCMPPMSSRQVL